MDKKTVKPTWAPRISKSKIGRLYELDAKGIYDEELIDEVGYSLLMRCKSFIDANMAVNGKAKCPVCSNIVTHKSDKKETLICEGCGWQLSWGVYFSTIQKKQLSGAKPVIAQFKGFINDYSKAQSPEEKMIHIDQLLHGFHIDLKSEPTRPVAMNLIEGRLPGVIKFLDDLSYGEGTSAKMRKTYEVWKVKSQNARVWTEGRNHDD